MTWGPRDPKLGTVITGPQALQMPLKSGFGSGYALIVTHPAILNTSTCSNRFKKDSLKFSKMDSYLYGESERELRCPNSLGKDHTLDGLT